MGWSPCLASVGKYFYHLLALFPVKRRHHFPVANSQSYLIQSQNWFTALVKFGLKCHLDPTLFLDPTTSRSVTQRPGAHLLLMSSTGPLSPPAQMLPWLRGRHLSPWLRISLLKTGLPALGFLAPTQSPLCGPRDFPKTLSMPLPGLKLFGGSSPPVGKPDSVCPGPAGWSFGLPASAPPFPCA